MAELQTQPPEWIHTAPIQVSATREIAATADEVFAALADHESWPEWFSSIDRVERLGDLRDGIGSHRRVHINKRVTVAEEFVVWEPGKAWGFTIVSSSIGGLRSMNELVTIQEIGPDRVRVTYKMGIAPKPYLAPVVRLARRGLEKNLGRALENLGPVIASRRSR
jgi:carbon monoxide dehydrogenase subunit G